MKDTLIEVMREVGEGILDLFGDTRYSIKGDNSPFTPADQISHNMLVKYLPKIKNIPILSEECHIPYEERKKWDMFWLIDPLDGTKNFLNGCKEFCINVALIHKKRPVLGIIYAPMLEELYYARKGEGLFSQCPHLEFTKTQGCIVTKSRFYHSSLTEEFIKFNSLEENYTLGSAIKFGRIALGHAHLYPRFEGSKEWDTAAGQIILEESKGGLLDLKTQKSMVYNKPLVQNNFFLAYASCALKNSLRIPKCL